MLTDLSVKGLGVIDHAELSLRPGCIALTGETGAGKTLVVTALSLLLGGRTDRGLVRHGAARAEVEARFEVHSSHDAAALVADASGEQSESGETEILLQRVIGADGKTRARINGSMVPLTMLRDVASQLVEIAGQNEHQELLRPAVHSLILDSFCGPEVLELRSRLKDILARSSSLQRRFDERVGAEQQRIREADTLDYEIGEIEQVRPLPGELEELVGAVRRLENAEQLGSAIRAAAGDLRGEGGAGDRIAGAIKAIRSVTDADPALAPFVERLDAIAADLDDAGAEILARSPDPDPAAVDQARERIALLNRLQKKYGDPVQYLEEARRRRADLDLADIEIERLESEIAELREEATALAGRLTAARVQGAPELETEVGAWLAQLALAEARVEARLTPRPLSEGGAETVDLCFSAGGPQPPRPLADVASGGELARVALALKLVTSHGAKKTMLFDEVDAGVGGKAAQAVGAALARLAAERQSQVIVVTHLPQVAAHADQHLRVEKVVAGGSVAATVEEVVGEARVEELSRMLAGLPESDRARHHARELLEMTGVLGS